MKHLKLYATMVLSSLILTGVPRAQAAAAASGNQSAAAPAAASTKESSGEFLNGKVQAFIVQGDVSLIKPDGTRVPLKKGDTFEEGHTVAAGANGMALMVFSNGATMRVTSNAQMEITRFKQVPFDDKAEGGTFLRLTKDPSRSETKLYLNNGTLQGEVKQLNQAAGSQFTVNTPAGSAGIRGTIVSISVVRDATGRVTSVVANCLIGNMAFTPATGGSATTSNGTTQNAEQLPGGGVNVPGGAQVQITLTVDADGRINGFNVGGAGLPSATSDQIISEVFGVVNQARTEFGLQVAPPPPPPNPTDPTPEPGSNVSVTQTNPTDATPGTTTVTVTAPGRGTISGSVSGNTVPPTNPTTISE